MEPLAKLHAFPAAVLRYRQIDNVLKRNLVVLLRNLRQAGTRVCVFSGNLVVIPVQSVVCTSITRRRPPAE
jgi:hypothetical protein